MKLDFASVNAGRAPRSIQGSGAGQPSFQNFVTTEESIPFFEQPNYQAPEPSNPQVLQQHQGVGEPFWAKYQREADLWSAAADNIRKRLRVFPVQPNPVAYDPWIQGVQQASAIGKAKTKFALVGVNELTEVAKRVSALVSSSLDNADKQMAVFNQLKNSADPTEKQKAANAYDAAQEFTKNANESDSILTRLLDATGLILATLEQAWIDFEEATDQLDELIWKTRTVLAEQGNKQILEYVSRQLQITLEANQDAQRMVEHVAETNRRQNVLWKQVQHIGEVINENNKIDGDGGGVMKSLMLMLALGIAATVGISAIKR